MISGRSTHPSAIEISRTGLQMPLLSLWSSNPEAVTALSIEQIVSTAGDGKLLDDSECSDELRTFLSQVPSERLAAYADHCLSAAFQKSGFVLQDIVNELGRRLEYAVSGGRYQGKSNAIGNDGLWRLAGQHDVLVEVKTTDAYRVALDTIAGYRDRLREAKQILDSSSILLVVGREDTGELEAQIRGSRHAWDMRLISVDALLRLVRLKESADSPETIEKIRSILRPMEYTRLDNLIDVIFTAATDVEPPPGGNGEDGGFEFTDPKLLQTKRDQIVAGVARRLGIKLVRKSRALFWDAGHLVRVACTVSKRYTKKAAAPYWYAYHPGWDDFLGQAPGSQLVLGCMDLPFSFAIPLEVVREHLNELNTTTKDDGTSYWHVKILEPQPGKYLLQMPRSGMHIPLEPYVVHI